MFYSTGNQDSHCGKQDYKYIYTGFPASQMAKQSTCSAEDLGSIPASGRSPGEGKGNPLQYSCLENPMEGGAWWATVHGVTKSRTQLMTSLSLSPLHT